jgi:hypothetical protein
MAAADTLVLPIQRIDWPSVKMRFEARAAGKKILQFLDNSYQYVQEPVEAASFQEHEAVWHLRVLWLWVQCIQIAA